MKEKLKRYIMLLSEIELLKKQIVKIEPEYVRDSVKGSTIAFPYIECKIKIEGYDIDTYKKRVIRLNNRITRKMNELVEEKEEIIEFIYSIEDSVTRQIFILKYLQGFRWEEISEMIRYSKTAVRDKHREIINSLKSDT